MRKSRVVQKLEKEQPVLCTCVNAAMSPLIVELVGRIGFDTVWLDMEHRPIAWQDVSHLTAAARNADLDSLVRIRKGEGYTSFFRPFEDGAAGIMVPHVTSREEALYVVQNAKYAPLGRRGMENVMHDADCGLADTADYMQHANNETFIVIQIEDPEGVDAIDEIASVDGIDVLFIGPGDLTQQYGIIGQLDHPRMQKTVDAIAAAADRHGKAWGMPCSNTEQAARILGNGARFIAAPGDYSQLREGFIRTYNEFTALFV